MAFPTLRSRPRSGPPSPPVEWYGRGGGGDGHHRLPRIVWVALILALVGAAFGLYELAMGIMARPIPVIAAVSASLVGVWTVRHRLLDLERR